MDCPRSPVSFVAGPRWSVRGRKQGYWRCRPFDARGRPMAPTASLDEQETTIATVQPVQEDMDCGRRRDGPADSALFSIGQDSLSCLEQCRQVPLSVHGRPCGPLHQQQAGAGILRPSRAATLPVSQPPRSARSGYDSESVVLTGSAANERGQSPSPRLQRCSAAAVPVTRQGRTA